MNTSSLSHVSSTSLSTSLILNFFSPTVSTPIADATDDNPGTVEVETTSSDEESGATVTEVSEPTQTHLVSLGDIQLSPNQPKRNIFPSVHFGSQSRSFQYGWFEK